nr:hypothetical protein CFP56_42137 [Quercus suber]
MLRQVASLSGSKGEGERNRRCKRGKGKILSLRSASSNVMYQRAFPLLDQGVWAALLGKPGTPHSRAGWVRRYLRDVNDNNHNVHHSLDGSADGTAAASRTGTRSHDMFVVQSAAERCSAARTAYRE